MRTDLDITGRPAQFGRGIMAEVGDRIVQQFASRLEELLRNPVPVSDAGARTADGEGPAPVFRAQAEPEAVDLGAAALPVLFKKAAAPAAAVLLAIVLIRAFRRRSAR